LYAWGFPFSLWKGIEGNQMTLSWIFTVQYSLLLVRTPPLPGTYDKLDMALEWSGKNDFGCRELLPLPH